MLTLLSALLIIWLLTSIFSIRTSWTPIKEISHVDGTWLWDVRVTLSMRLWGAGKPIFTWILSMTSAEP